MALRPTWQGHLKLSLVTCPVVLYSALNSASDVRFHLINPKTNNRVRMVTTDAETGEPLNRSDLVKGYEVQKDQYVILNAEDFSAVRLESTKTIDIEHFVPAEEIDRLYWDHPYYMAPDGKVAAEAFGVIREAMERDGQIALGRVVMATRERVLALEPRGKGILATTLRSSEEVRDVEAIFRDADAARADKDMIAIAQKIIAQKASTFSPTLFTDRYEAALRALIEKKLKGKKIVAAPAPETTNVIDLMEALKKSLGAPEGRAPPKAPARAASGARAQAASAPDKRAKAKR